MKGKVRNTGGQIANDVRVKVRLLDRKGRKITDLRAQCPEAVEPGAEARFEARYEGDRRGDVERIKVRVRCD